jgi:hypothetical protein
MFRVDSNGLLNVFRHVASIEQLTEFWWRAASPSFSWVIWAGGDLRYMKFEGGDFQSLLQLKTSRQAKKYILRKCAPPVALSAMRTDFCWLSGSLLSVPRFQRWIQQTWLSAWWTMNVDNVWEKYWDGCEIEPIACEPRVHNIKYIKLSITEVLNMRSHIELRNLMRHSLRKWASLAFWIIYEQPCLFLHPKWSMMVNSRTAVTSDLGLFAILDVRKLMFWHCKTCFYCSK